MKKGLDRRIKKKWLPVYAGIWIVMAAMVVLLAEDIVLILELKAEENRIDREALQAFNVTRNVEFAENAEGVPLNLTGGG